MQSVQQLTQLTGQYDALSIFDKCKGHCDIVFSICIFVKSSRDSALSGDSNRTSRPRVPVVGGEPPVVQLGGECARAGDDFFCGDAGTDGGFRKLFFASDGGGGGHSISTAEQCVFLIIGAKSDFVAFEQCGGGRNGSGLDIVLPPVGSGFTLGGECRLGNFRTSPCGGVISGGGGEFSGDSGEHAVSGDRVP